MNKIKGTAGLCIALFICIVVFSTFISCERGTDTTENTLHTSGTDLSDKDDVSGAVSDVEVDMKVKITVEGKNAVFTAQLYDTDAAEELYAMLPVYIEMSDMPHEKYCYLEFSLTISEEKPQNIRTGDIMLWGSNCLVFFYEDFTTSYSYTGIGKILDTEGLVSAFKGDTTLKIEAL